MSSINCLAIVETMKTHGVQSAFFHCSEIDYSIEMIFTKELDKASAFCAQIFQEYSISYKSFAQEGTEKITCKLSGSYKNAIEDLTIVAKKAFCTFWGC